MQASDKILDQTNPVYNTAKLTLSVLSSAGVPEAIKYADKLGFTDIRKNFEVNAENNSELPHAIVQETRYEFLNRVIRESNCKNIVDVACGFSPRGYVMAKEGYNYLGLDLEASVTALNTLADTFKEEKFEGSFRYRACDLTNPDLFEKCLDDIDGEVLIICEGLLMYFQEYETKSFCEGIKRVLRKHGGKFVTGDYAFSDLYVGVHIQLLGKEEGMKALMTMANKTKEKSDTNFKESLVKPNGSPAAVELYTKMGFDIDKIPYYTTDEKCRIFEKLESDVVTRMKNGLGQYMAWVVTVKEDLIEDTVNTEKIEYKASYSMEGTILKLVLEGRVDSLTSTDLMKVYANAKENHSIEAVEVDMSRMQYISSAGLRVLLIMKKEVSSNIVKCLNVKKEVMDIFETTGFDSVLDL